MSAVHDKAQAVDVAAQKATVLIVDDHPANLIATRAALMGLDIEVVTVESGPLALAAAETHEFAVILLDLMMPGMDGLETLTRLRLLAKARHMPVVVMTAMDRDLTLVKRAYALGVADYITKPIDADILFCKVQVFVTLWQQARALVLKDRFVGMLAHDLRTPLATVVMAASRLTEHSDPAVGALGSRIQRAAARMSNLTEDVLEFARATATELPLSLVEMDLAALCRECLDDMRATHHHVMFWDTMPATLSGRWDRARLQQALSNVLGNAVKYGNGWVRLKVESDDQDVVVTVENEGTIASDDLERLFQPFKRGTHQQPGVGLGLYIVREIVRAHGGQVDAVGDSNNTQFRLRLPLRAKQGKLGAGSSSSHPPRDVQRGLV
jgi:signal transduction histidine kinase